MRNALKISIPDPCSVRWSDMTPIEEGKRHCGSCDRIITDFTQMSDAQLLSYFRNHTVHCGRFSRHQLDREICESPKQRTPWLVTLLLPALLSVTQADAQSKPRKPAVVQTDSVFQAIRVPIEAAPITADTIEVYGQVIGRRDSLHESVLPLAMLTFRNKAGASYSCVADSNGSFRLRLDSARLGDTLDVEVKYRSYQPYAIAGTLTQQLPMEIMEIQVQRIPEDDIMGKYPRGYAEPDVVCHVPWYKRVLRKLLHPRDWF